MEPKFMSFLRFIEILDKEDALKINGQKIVDKIFQVEMFKAF